MAASSFAAAAESGETAWLNALLEEAWPFVSRAVLLELRERLQPAVRTFMPSYLPSVVFTKLDLGSLPPRITSIAVRDAAALAQADMAISGEWAAEGPGSSYGGEPKEMAGRWVDGELTPVGLNGGSCASSGSSAETSDASEKAHWGSRGVAAEAIVIEMGVEYEGKLNIEMALESAIGTTFGIDSAKLTGRVEVIISPLIPRVPLGAAFQAAFLNPPSIDFNLTGIAAAGDMGPWTGAFRGVVDQVVASFVVLPNRVNFKIDPAVDFLAMAHVSRPVGVLRIAVLRGHGFPHTDESTIKQTLGQSAEPDVYVLLRLGAVEHRTVRVDDCEHPVFDSQVFDFVLASNSPHQQLLVEAYDYDLGKDDELGTAAVKVETLVREPELVVRLKHAPLGATPRVRLAARFLRLSTSLSDVQCAVLAQRDPTRPKSCSSLLLAVAIDRASGLPLAEATRPFVRVLLDGRGVVETWPAIQNDAAAYSVPLDAHSWDFSRHVLVEKPVDAGSRVMFEVRDASLYNRKIGYAFLHLADLLRSEGCAKVYNFALVGCARAGATLRVRVGMEAAVADGPPLWQLSSAARQRAKAGPGFSSEVSIATPGSSANKGTSTDGSVTQSSRALGSVSSWAV